MTKPRLVILESPYAGDVEANLAYARRCAHRCALMGEATQASHLYYTQFLDDTSPQERALGIELGLAWAKVADYSVFFTDLGWSRGMRAALITCLEGEKMFYLRSLSGMALVPHEITEFGYVPTRFIDMEYGALIKSTDK